MNDTGNLLDTHFRKQPLHPLAESVLRAAETMAAKEMTANDLDDVMRAAAALIRVARLESLRRAGATQSGRWSAKGPFVRRERRGYSVYAPSGLVDHARRVKVLCENGKCRELFVAHPYDLDEEALRQLVAVADEGWAIRIDGRSEYFPSETVRIVYERGNREDWLHRHIAGPRSVAATEPRTA